MFLLKACRPIFDDFHRHQSFALVQQKGKWRFLKHNGIGTTGETLPKVKFDGFKFYQQGNKLSIGVENKGKWGLYDKYQTNSKWQL